MPKRDGGTAQSQRDPVATHAPILPPQPKPEDDGQGEHEGTLEPAEHARCLPQNLADEEHGKRRGERDDPGQAKGRLSGKSGHDDQILCLRSARISSAGVP